MASRQKIVLRRPTWVHVLLNRSVTDTKVPNIVARADSSQYLCIAEQSAGLHYDKQTKAWAPQAFVTHQKYILRRLNGDDRKNWLFLLQRHPDDDWGFFEFGETYPMALCTSKYGFGCDWGDVRLDKGSLRFSRSYYSGYTNQGWLETLRKEDPDEYQSQLNKYKTDADNPDDLAIEIGKCTPF